MMKRATPPPVMRLRSVIPEEGVTGQRYEGVRDFFKEESFCFADDVWFGSGNLHGEICHVRAKALDV